MSLPTIFFVVTLPNVKWNETEVDETVNETVNDTVNELVSETAMQVLNCIQDNNAATTKGIGEAIGSRGQPSRKRFLNSKLRDTLNELARISLDIGK